MVCMKSASAGKKKKKHKKPHENQAAGFAAKNTWNKILVSLNQAQILTDFKKPVILKATNKVLVFKIGILPILHSFRMCKDQRQAFFSAFYIRHVGLSIL